MEKPDIEEATTKVEAQEGQDGSSNAGDDWECKRQLTLKEISWIGVLPATVWENITNMLLGDHCLDDLKTLTMASPLFRDLLFSKRVLFLFPEVLKIIGPRLENEERASEDEKSSILTCRSVCKSWNKSVDHYIDASAKPDFFQDPPPPPKDPAMINARYKYFGFMVPERLQKFLDYFDQSHQPDSGGFQRNPFIGTTVAICNDVYTRDHIKFCENVITMLQKYGQYIRVLVIKVHLPMYFRLRDYLWLMECLQLTPNLTHLKVKQRADDFGNTENTVMDPYFGEHAYRSDSVAEYMGRRVSHELQEFPDEYQQEWRNDLKAIFETERRFSGDGQNYDLEEHYLTSLKTTRLNQERRQGRRNPIVIPDDPNDDEYWNPISGRPPLPVLKNLECLQLHQLSPKLFNPLIQSYQQITWLHIYFDPLNFHGTMPRHVEWWTLDFPNLKKLYIQFPGGQNEVRRLRNLHPSFLLLTSLHFEYPSPTEYMCWDQIFQILEQNWGGTLAELKIRLPNPRNVIDMAFVEDACENSRLLLPKLKRLVIWKISELYYDHDIGFNANLDFHFLDLIRKNLDEFFVLEKLK